MKLYTAILAASLFIFSGYNKHPQKQRCFIVGYVSDGYSGTISAFSSGMINADAVIDLIETKYGKKNVTIVSVSEFSKEDIDFFFKSAKPSPSPLPDSLPKYRYIMKAEIPSGQYFASLDSIERYFMPVIGRTLTVEQAEDYKKFLSTQIFRIIQYARPDSVKIEGGGK